MLEHQLDTMDSAHPEENEIEEDTQITVQDTGWIEEEKERMKQFGYDGLDMVRAWYN